MREGKEHNIAYLHERDGCGQIECAVSKGVKLYLTKSFLGGGRKNTKCMALVTNTTG